MIKMNLYEYVSETTYRVRQTVPSRGKTMLSNQKLQTALTEIREVSRIDFLLYDVKGKLTAYTGELPEDEEALAGSVNVFAASMAEIQMQNGYHFFKVMVEEEPEYILLVPSIQEESYMVGRLALLQIRRIVESYRDQFDRNSFMQNILLGNMLVVDIYSKAERLKIRESEWVVFVIETRERKEPAMMELVKSLVDPRTRDFVTELDEKSVILVKDVKHVKEESEIEEQARMLVDTIHAEAMVKVRVGYGNRAGKLSDIPRSYQEAMLSLRVGEIFYGQRDTISYQKLGIGRLIYQLPQSLCEMFIQEVFAGRDLDIDEETLQTVERFFENDLNISETARQLYIHRNTLVYRLERFQKIIGLDVRKFEDAMTFKLAMMVLAHMQSLSGGDQNIE